MPVIATVSEGMKMNVDIREKMQNMLKFSV